MKKLHKIILYTFIVPFLMLLVVIVCSGKLFFQLKTLEKDSIYSCFLWEELNSSTTNRFLFRSEISLKEWNEKKQAFGNSLGIIDTNAPEWLIGSELKDKIDRTEALWKVAEEKLNNCNKLYENIIDTPLGHELKEHSYIKLVEKAYSGEAKVKVSMLQLYRLEGIMSDFDEAGKFFKFNLELLANQINQRVNALVKLIILLNSIISVSIIVGAILFFKLSQRELAESEENLRITLLSIGDAVISTDILGNIVHMNLVAEKMTGWTEAEASGKALSEVLKIINAKTRNVCENPVEKVISEGKTIGLANHTILIAKNGEEYQIADSAAPVRDTYGKMVGVVLVFRDVTEEYAMQEQLNKLRSYLSNVINSMPSVLIGVDVDCKVTHWNTMAEKITKVPSIEAIGELLDKIVPHFSVEMNLVREVLETQEKRSLLRKSRQTENQTLYEDTTIYPLISNGIKGAVIRVDDMTDQHKLEERIKQSSTMEALGQLSGGIAHDFNNILSALLGYTELSQSKIPKDNVVNEYLEGMHQAIVRGIDLVQQILAYTRKDTDEKHPVSLQEIIHEVITLLDLKIPDDIKISTDLEQESNAIRGNSTQIHRIMMNLCHNAIHAMEEDGGLLTISLHSLSMNEDDSNKYNLPSGSYVELKVADTGSGIKPKNLSRIFEPFFTSKKLGKGSGLGLAVVHGIVKSHGGDISVESNLGKGTVFTIILPTINIKVVPKDSDKKLLQGNGENILLVDDEKDLTTIGSKIMEFLGYKVTTVNSSPEALEIFKNSPDKFNLLMTDHLMPDMTGLELAKSCLEIRPHLPVILCTGFSKNISEKDVLAAGVKKFLNKPIQRKDMANALDQLLSEKR